MNKNKINPKEIEFLFDLTKDSYSQYILDNSFVIFNSINNLKLIVYSNKNNNIIVYDLENQQKIGEIKYHHHNYISGFKHVIDKKNNKDLVISISCEDNNIFVWDITCLKCILNIIKVNNGGVLFSSCFLNYNDNLFILSSNSSQSPFYINFEPIKLFDLNGQMIKKINNSEDKAYYIDTYYDNLTKKIFIITCNFNYLKSYDYEKNELYFEYYDKDDGAHYTFEIYNINNKINLMESSNSGIIRIWDFHSGKILDKINFNNKRIFSFCLWDKDYLFVGCDDHSIKLIELETKNIIKCLDGHNNIVLTLKKINHSKFGESLISKGFKEDQIKIWSKKLNKFYQSKK